MEGKTATMARFQEKFSLVANHSESNMKKEKK